MSFLKKTSLPVPSEELLLRAIQVSGFTALGYEMLWVRRFSHFFGSTAQVFSMILVAVLAGIALGAFAFTRLSRRRALDLRSYGYLEGAIALSSASAYVLSGCLPHRLPTTSLAAFAITFLLTGFTCSLIGCSLPWLTRVVSERHGERATARAYSFYNLGSALATVLVGSFLFLLVGYAWCCYGLAALNAALGVYFFSVGGGRTGAAPTTASVKVGGKATALVLLIGFVTLFVETLHGQLLDYLLGGTRIGISATLGTYFVAVSLGASRGGGTLRRSLLWQLAALAALGGLLFLPNPLPTFLDGKWVAAVVLVIYAFYSYAGGQQFPALVRWLAEGCASDENGVFSFAFYAETLAGIAGTLAFSFFCLPNFGSEASVLLAASMTLAALALLTSRGWTWGGTALALLLLGVIARPAPLSLVRSAIASLERGDSVRYAQEDHNGLLMVVNKRDGELEIRNAYYVSGSTDIERRNTQVTQGFLAASLLPESARVLQIGYGNGEITRALLSAKPRSIDIVEIHPQMVPVADHFFGGVQVGDTALHTIVADGVAYARGASDRYDLVISDSFIISSEMSVRLYTRDHFQNVKRLLRGKGVLLTWIPTYIGTASSLSILKALTGAFQHTQLFYPTFGLGHELYALSYDEPRDLLAVQREGLRHIGPAMTSHRDLPIDPDFFWTRWLASDSQVRALLAEHPEVRVNEEDRPVLEYYASVKRPRETGPSLLDTLVSARAERRLGEELSSSTTLRADWLAAYRRYLALEEATRAYLQQPSAEKAAALAKGFPKTNLAALARAVEERRAAPESRWPASK